VKIRYRKKKEMAAFRAATNFNPNYFVPFGYYANRPYLMDAILNGGLGTINTVRFISQP